MNAHGFLFLQSKIPYFNSLLLILLGFFLPLSISISTLIIAVIVLFWLIDGRFLEKYKVITSHSLSYAFLAFFSVHLLGLLWTEDLQWGLHIVSKEWRLLLFPIFLTIVYQEHIKHYITSFLIALSFSEICSYLIWFKIIPPINNATIENPTPFVSHLSYNPLLAFSIYLLLHFLIFENKNSLIFKAISVFFIVTMSINMFITGGRAGQIVFFMMIVLIAIQYFKKNIIKILLIVFIALPSVFYVAYSSSDIFHERVTLAINEAKAFKETPNTSVGLRLTFLLNSIEIIKNHPLLGVGTGDFPTEYKKINEIKTPNAYLPKQPHNMYILVLVQTGLLGFLSLLSIFYTQIKLSFQKNELKNIRIALPILFLVIMLSDSYLLGHYTTLFFVYFSSFLYKDFQNETL